MVVDGACLRDRSDPALYPAEIITEPGSGRLADCSINGDTTRGSNPTVSPADAVFDLTQVFGFVFVITSQISVEYGYGRHTAALEVNRAETALFWNMVSFIFGILSFAIPKLAVAALLHRILNPTLIHRVIIWGLVSLVAAVAVVNILIYVTMCDPPKGLWEFSMVQKGEATCRNVWILVNYARFNGGKSSSVSIRVLGESDADEIGLQPFPLLLTCTSPSIRDTCSPS